MCGLVGVLGTPGEQLSKMFADMLQFDVIRGWDSTGVLAVRPHRDDRTDTYWVTVKDTDVPQYLFMHQDWDEVVGSKYAVNNNFCLMGHNRAATKGKVTHNNAHPFMHDNIILAHNGTLWSTFQLWDTIDQSFDTDSETLCAAIARKGVKWAWGRTDGAASLSYWNDENKTLNLITNDKRPLFFAYDKDQRYMMWASEAWMIRVAASRHHVEIEKVFKPAKDTLFSFRYDIKEKTITERRKKIPPFVEKAKPTRPYTPPLRGNIRNGMTGKGSNIVPLSSPGTSGINGNVSFEQVKKELTKKFMTKKQFEETYSMCQFCRETLDYDDSVIVDGGIAVCGTCFNVAEEENIMIFGGM